ncbi:AAA family ATPase [Streptomyces hygroscopicus]|uniref:helix-turn-helix transcriptional regulator n=1 Tax=Streptomyces hygroscopicus TaxID=1912 RepID=UPI00099E693C
MHLPLGPRIPRPVRPTVGGSATGCQAGRYDPTAWETRPALSSVSDRRGTVTWSFSENSEAPEEGRAPCAAPAGIGRNATIERLWEAVTSATGPAVQLVRGEVGAGRTTVFAALAERLRSTYAVYQVACQPGDHLTPGLLAHRLLLALHQPAPSPASPAESAADARPPQDPPQPRPDPRGDAETLLGLFDRSLRGRGPAVILIDDAQHADPESVSLLRSVVSGLGSPRLLMSVAPVRCGWPAEQQAERAALTPLYDSRAVGITDLPPLTAPDIARILAVRLHAVPDEDLVAEVHRLSGGNAAAVTAAAGGLAESGMVRVLIGHAQLVAHARILVLPDDDRFVRTLRGLGDVVWRVAKALSLLEHMGATTARLIATATGLPDRTVGEALHRLVRYGFVIGPDGGRAAHAGGWAFRIPLVARAMRARLGPYERRVTSAIAVRALWARPSTAAGGAPEGNGRGGPAAHDAYLADRILDAGTLLERERAARELFRVAERLRTTHGRRAWDWLRTAVELADDPAPGISAVLAHASDAVHRGDSHVVEETATTLVRAHPLDALTRHTLAAVEITKLAATGDLAGLDARHRAHTAVVDRDSAVLAVLSASLLGLWSEVRDLVARTGLDQHPHPPQRAFGAALAATAMAVAGEPAAVYQSLRNPPERDAGPPWATGVFGALLHQCEALLAMGDVKTLTAFLDERRLTVDRLPPQDVFLYQFLRGDWREAMANARRLLVNALPTERVPVSALVPARASTMLLAQGWPSRAKAVLDIARSVSTPMAHLLDADEAAAHLFLGRADDARETLRRGLAQASESGYVLGTGPLWSALAVTEAAEGRPDAAVSCLGRLRRAVAADGEGGRLLYLRTRMEAVRLSPALRKASDDTASDGPEAVAVARAWGQPYETARTLLAAAAAPRAKPRGAHLLREAYDRFGQLDALLWRHRTRMAMKDAGITVPDRRRAAQEMDLLLARLVAEGLTNRQLAAALSLSETSVSSRLNRLFRRVGLRSRVELTAAVTMGDPLFDLG